MNKVTALVTKEKFVSKSVASLQDVLKLETKNSDPLGSISSTYDLLKRGTAIDPSAPALSFFLRPEDHTRPVVQSHGELMSRITQAANLFRRLGVQRQDVISFILPNLPETHWVIWGGETSGIVFAINPLLEPEMMAELMNAARPKILVTLAPTPKVDLWDKVCTSARLVPTLEHILTITPLSYLKSPLAPLVQQIMRLRTPRHLGRVVVRPFRDLLDSSPSDHLEFTPPNLDDIASYFCTGGTTGVPKIAVRTHRTEVSNALQLAATFGSELSDGSKTVFCALPLFHVNAQIGTGLAPWTVGANVILGTPQGYRTPGLIPRFWEIAERHRFVFFSGVPTVYSALLQHPPKGHNLSQLKYGICGAAPMPIELFKRFQNEIGVKILEGYGLTEGGCVSSLNPPGGESRPGSIGIRMPWQEMRTIILDANDCYTRDALIDEIGVVVIRGLNLFLGYLNPDHNRGLWVERPNSDGRPQVWLNTGDLGRIDQDGYFWLTGRKKELIIRGGHNIDPKMIDEVMHTHPAVALAAAVGRPDAHAGEVPVVFVQLRPGFLSSEEELLLYAQKHVAERAAWPKEIRLLPSLPTTAIGKIFKPALLQELLEAVVNEEARAANAVLTHCKAEHDAKRGLLVRWRAEANSNELKNRLGVYTFQNEEIEK